MIENKKLEEIFNNTIPHSNFLDKRSILSCMYQSYILGKEESDESYDKLEKTFEKLLNYYEKGSYFHNEIKEDWRKEAGLIK